MYVCVCNAVTEKAVFAAIDAGARRLRDLRETLGVAAECGRCASCAQACLRRHAPQQTIQPLIFARTLHHEGRQKNLAAA